MSSDIWELCGNQSLIDTASVFNSTYPKFTECFQNTLLVWIPCGLFLLYMPYQCYHLLSKKNTIPLNMGVLNMTKSLFTLILCLLMVVDLVKLGFGKNGDSGEIHQAMFVASAIKGIAFAAALVLIQVGRSKGVTTSGVLFLFWLVMLITGIVPFYTYIIEQYYEEDNFRFVLFYIYWCCVVVLFVLHWFAEIPDKDGYSVPGKEPCPEIFASFPSKLSFWWFNSVIWSGFRKTLEEDKMWDLRPQEKSKVVVPEFMVNWNKEIEESKRKNAKLKAEQLQETNGIRNGKDYDTKHTNAAEMTPLHSDKKTDEEEETSGKVKQHEPSIVRAIVRTYGKATTRGIFIRLIFDVLQFSNPMLLGLLIGYIQNKESEPEWKGYVLASLFYVNAIVMYSIVYHNDFNMQVLAMRLKSALVAALYNKSLVMNNKTKKSSTVGEIVNLMAVDCSRLEHINHIFVFCMSVPFRFILCVILLWNSLGPSVLAGVAILALLIPVNTIVSSKQRSYRKKMMDFKDERSKLMSEILNGMKVLKFYAWEPSFEKKVQDIRKSELRVLRTLFFLDTVYVFTFGLVPFMVGVVSFSIYIFTQEGSYLDPGKAFVALSLFDNLKFPMFVLPHLITYFIQARVSLERISKFIGAGELDPEGVKQEEDSDVALKIEKGTFSWDEKLDPALKNINVEIKKGKLIAIVGQVGTGKSSLLSAFLGEMDKLQGTVSQSGSMAYVPQQAWIQNATLRDNILFGKSFDESKYNKVLDACSLRTDLEVLSGGDMTEIGEKGINLSGGQKQRVNLARAVYNNSDIYLMDDPLSAVDSHVGKHIFENVIGENGLLRNKTRVLVTHGVHWLPLVDSIVVITNGEISECGTYDQLLDHDGAFAQFLKTYLIQNKEEEEDQECNELQDIKARVLHRLDSVMSVDEEVTSSPRSRLGSYLSESGDSMSLPRSRTTSHCKTNPAFERVISIMSIDEPSTPQPRTHRPNFDRSISHFDNGRCDESLTCKSFELLMTDVDKTDEDEVVKVDNIIQKEETEKGEVKLSVFMKYFRSIGLPWVILIIVVAVLIELAGAGASILLSRWTEDPILKNSSLVNTTEFKARNVMFIGVYAGLGFGQTVVDLLYTLVVFLRCLVAAKLLHNKMLLNILRLPMSFFDTTPVGRILNRFTSDVEKIDQNLPHNIRGVFFQTLHALITIIVISVNTPIFLSVILPATILYGVIQRFYVPSMRQLERFRAKTNSPIFSFFGETITGVSTIRAYGAQERFMLESQRKVDDNTVYRFSLNVAQKWSGLRLECVGNLFVLAAAMFAVMSSDINGGIAGLVVAYALQITGSLNGLVRTLAELETNVVSVERVKEYSEKEREADWINESHRPPSAWPVEGNIKFDNYKTRYREGLDLVLKGITCEIKGKEKVGVVGRTGAGKSSLMTALFRLIESADGKIVIDGENIADMGLHDLRTKLTILPQDPVLFSGTLQMNLDPFDNFRSDQLWTALEHAHLKKFVSELPEGLQYECGEGGQNLSVGQRQLVCLARALLHKTKVLILDEATAAVDMETDDLIQKTIRTEFKDCSILAIAHRLNTIMDYDKVLVLGEGLVLEYNSPTNLLNDKTSVFYGMAKDANLV